MPIKNWRSNKVAFPEPLRRAIISRNHAILCGAIPAYFYQIEKAARRGDPVSVNHRSAALLASYFDNEEGRLFEGTR